MTDTETRWASLNGDFAFDETVVRFRGSSVKYGEESGAAVGTALCNQYFGAGRITAELVFHEPTERSACDLVLYHNAATRAFVSAGLSNEVQYGVRYFDNRWTTYSAVGDKNRLVAERPYLLDCRVRGSNVTLFVDGVEVTSVALPVPLPRSQVGVWCRDIHDISIRSFQVEVEAPRVFVVMQFTSPYNELYQEVVKPICASLGIQAIRADETFGPGLIIADVVRQIEDAKFVIAEITPANPNVYYEVGYAHARSKPTILIADRTIDKLPFDVSPFRTLFYENTIDGKRRVEDGLRRHIRAIMDPSGTGTV